MTRLHLCGWFLSALLAAVPVASAQRVNIEVRCAEGDGGLGRSLGRELSAIGIEPNFRDLDGAVPAPLLQVICNASGELVLRFEEGERLESVTLAASEDTTSRALRISEYTRAWLAAPPVAPVAEDSQSETPETDSPDPLDEPEAEPETSEASQNDGTPDEEGSEEATDPQTESEASPDEPEPVDSEADPTPDFAPSSLGATLALGSFFGQGDSSAALSITGELTFRFYSVWRARAGVGAQVAGGGISNTGDEIETSLLRVSGDLSYLWAFGSKRWQLALGLGSAALRVKARGVGNVLSMPPQDDSTWVSWTYAVIGVSMAVHPLLRVYTETRGGLVPSRVLTSSFADPLPVLVGWVRFEASLGLEVSWPI